MVFDTVCRATEERQNELRKLAQESDYAIIIGDKASANSNRLYEISKEYCNSQFIEKGINQTLHSIYVDIKGDVKLEIPFSNYKNELKSSVLVCETVLVGKVPELYLNGKLFS